MSTGLVIAEKLQLSEEQYLQVEQMAAVNYGPREVAVYLGVDVKLFKNEFTNPDTKIHYHYARGVLKATAEVDMKLLENATSGNITATQEYKKASEKRAFHNHKMRILNEGWMFYLGLIIGFFMGLFTVLWWLFHDEDMEEDDFTNFFN